jgi:hypothetical protein
MIGGGGALVDAGRVRICGRRADRYKPPVGTWSPTRCASPQLPAPSSTTMELSTAKCAFHIQPLRYGNNSSRATGQDWAGAWRRGTLCFWFLNLHRCAGRTPTPTPRTSVTDTQLSQIHRITAVLGGLPCLRSWSAMPHEHEPSLSSRRLTNRQLQQPATRSEFSPPLPPCAHHHRSTTTGAYKHPNDLLSGTRSARPGARPRRTGAASEQS